MTTIGFLGNPARLKPGSKDNTGNIVHGHAARSIFRKPQPLSKLDDPETAARTRQNYSHLAFVAATMLHVNKVPGYIESHARMADFLEKTGLPVVTFGFGCHAALGQSLANAEVDPRSVRLLRVIADLSQSIAVRGEFTADLCRKYGVTNVEVVGCQSAYAAGLANWTRMPKVAQRPSAAVGHLSYGPDERHVLDLIMREGADIISQGNPLEEAIAAGRLSCEDFTRRAHEFGAWPEVRALLANGPDSARRYHAFIRERFHIFYDVETWMAHLERYDFAFGTRFHGNMIAFHAGVPTLWLVHDMRTQELCEHLSLPKIAHADIGPKTSLAQIAEPTDYSAFEAAFPANLAHFMSYLERNGVTHLLRPELRQAARAITG